jgi:glycosyltransferase involved in cell wall biosynthesis
LVISRLRRYKRVDVAIRALCQVRDRHPNARLAVIGTGPERARLAALARRLDQPVIFLGQVSDSEKVRWLNRAHALINPSLKEGWGMVATEAMATGTVPVVSDVAGHRDSVPDHCGVRVPYGDVAALAGAVIELVRDPVASRRLRDRGLAWAQRFSWESCAEGMEEVLARAASQLAGERPLQEAHR